MSMVSMFNNLICAVITFLKALFGISNKSFVATVDMGQADSRLMPEHIDAPVSFALSTAEIIPDVSEKQSNTIQCGIAEACEEQNSLAATAPAPRISKPARTKNQTAAVQAFVFEALRAGSVLAATVVQSAEEAGFTRHQVRHACQKLEIVRIKLPGMRTGWLWSLPGANVSPDTGSPIHTCGCSESGVA